MISSTVRIGCLSLSIASLALRMSTHRRISLLDFGTTWVDPGGGHFYWFYDVHVNEFFYLSFHLGSQVKQGYSKRLSNWLYAGVNL